jgi:DNA-binding winged helix-turn-helix (wHTH) protein/uncharacterized protein HemY
MAVSGGSAPQFVRFATFELNFATLELRNNGAKVKIEGQPLRLLAMLLDRPGEVVSREDLQKKLWSGDTHVDFDHGINVAVQRLREALKDSATAPRFIETLPRRGYRFIYPLLSPPAEPPGPKGTAVRHVRLKVLAGIAILFLLVALAELRNASSAPETGSGASSPVHTVNVDALAAYGQGLYLVRKGTDEDAQTASELFQKAVHSDENFAPAYGQLALLLARAGNRVRPSPGAPPPSFRGPPDRRTVARNYADRALALDAALAEPHAALGWLEMADWHWQSAEEHFRRAIDIDPKLTMARVWYGVYLSLMGRSTEALEQAKCALQADPQPNFLLPTAGVYLRLRRPDDAIAVATGVLRLEDSAWLAHALLGDSYLQKGLYPEAIAAYEKAIALGGGGTDNIRGGLARAYAKNGQPKRARQILAAFQRLATTRDVTPYAWIEVYIAVGEYDRALDWVEKSYDRHGETILMLNQELFDAVRTNPRFQAILRRVGLPEATSLALGASVPGR